MKILVICSGNFKEFNFKIHQAFIYDQIEAIKKSNQNIHFDIFFIRGKGIRGYLKNLPMLRQMLKKQDYKYVHAHFVFSSLLANLQKKVPVISTFHGSDINKIRNRIFSAIVEIMSKKTIYVSRKLLKKALIKNSKKNYVIPCGVDLDLFKPRPKQESREKTGLKPNKKYILFSSSFTSKVKNCPLAEAAVSSLSHQDIELLELKNYNRDEVAVLMNAVDLALMTSFSEGSPQFVKEALACNCPVVSTDVGDVRELIENIDGCFITSFEVNDVADKIIKALEFNKAFNGRKYIKKLDNKNIAQKVIEVYS